MLIPNLAEGGFTGAQYRVTSFGAPVFFGRGHAIAILTDFDYYPSFLTRWKHSDQLL